MTCELGTAGSQLVDGDNVLRERNDQQLMSSSRIVFILYYSQVARCEIERIIADN